MRKKKVPPSVRKKTEFLIRSEGKDPAQAYATAWSMKRKNRLDQHGNYRHVKRGNRSGRR